MALITVTGEPGCRVEEAARLTAQRLRFEFIGDSRIQSIVAGELGPTTGIPPKAWPPLLASILARLGTEHHLAIAIPGAEMLFPNYPGMLRVKLIAGESHRLGSFMLDHQLDRAAARQQLAQLEAQTRALLRARFGRVSWKPAVYDLIVNTEMLDSAQAAALIEAAAGLRGLAAQGLFSPAGEAQLQFQMRLQLARHGIVPPDRVHLKRNSFANPSEQIFANLLDFYCIAWEYEPRSFPLTFDKDGRVLESFTPDFYLPEFDLYVELTTMKQSLVTKKNRKVKLLRQLYPHVNIQVFYQKDFRNLIFKYGLAERPVAV